MNSFLRRKRDMALGWMVFAAGASLTFLVMFCGVIAYQTVFMTTPPLRLGPGTGVAWVYSPRETVFQYSRAFEVLDDSVAMASRVIVCETGSGIETFDAPAIRRLYKAGNYANIRRTLIVPIHLPVGTPCKMTTYVTWRPMFSITDKTFELEATPFVVQQEP